MFTPGSFYKYAFETVNRLKGFLVTVSDRGQGLGALLYKNIKTTVDFQQTIHNFVLMQFHLFISLSQLQDADKQAVVNRKSMDRAVSILREFYFPDFAPQTKGRMVVDVPINDTAEVVEVVNVDNPDDGLRRGTRSLQASSTFQSEQKDEMEKQPPCRKTKRQVTMQPTAQPPKGPAVQPKKAPVA